MKAGRRAALVVVAVMLTIVVCWVGVIIAANIGIDIELPSWLASHR